MKFKVGDEVRVITNDYGYIWHNRIGKIVDINTLSAWPYRVCGGSFQEKELELVNQPQIELLPADAKERKRVPLASGLVDYFPSALIEVAKVSQAGNDQHNPGEPLHWARGKSTDQADTMIRHFLERGTLDSDGLRHSAKMAWRALAILQLELEAAGAPMARGAKE